MVNNYTKMKKKYSLPDQKKLMERLEMEIEADKDPVILLQHIRNHLIERFFDLMKTIECMLFTGEGSDAGNLYQEQMIHGVYKEGFELYKTFNELYYLGLKLRCTHNREKDADFINKIFNMWPELEQKLILFFEALEKGWKEFNPEKDIKPETYHG